MIHPEYIDGNDVPLVNVPPPPALLPPPAPPPVNQPPPVHQVIHIATVHTDGGESPSRPHVHTNQPVVSPHPPVPVPSPSGDQSSPSLQSVSIHSVPTPVNSPDHEPASLNGASTTRRRHDSRSVSIPMHPDIEFKSRPQFRRSNCDQMANLEPKSRTMNPLQGLHAIVTAAYRTYRSEFLELESKQTHHSREESARKTVVAMRAVQLANLCPCFNYTVEVSVLCYWLTQHVVMGLQETVPRYCKQFAVQSFTDDVAGEWCFPSGDMLVFPRKNPDASHEILVALGDIITGIHASHNLLGSYATGLEITDRDDKEMKSLTIDCGLRTMNTPKMPSVFKPLFSSVYFKLANKFSSVKSVVALDLLQKACVVFIQLCDVAVVAKEHAKALLLANCLHTCTYVMDALISRGKHLLNNMVYTHFMAHYLLANRYYELMECATCKLDEQKCSEAKFKLDEQKYSEAKNELEPFFRALEGFQKDFPGNLDNYNIIRLASLPPIEKCSEKSLEHFNVVRRHLPAAWARSQFRYYHVATLEQLAKLQVIARKLEKLDNAMLSEMYQALQTVHETLSGISGRDSARHKLFKSDDIYILNTFLIARCYKYKAMFRFPSVEFDWPGSAGSSPVESFEEALAAFAVEESKSSSVSIVSGDMEEPSTSSSTVAVLGPSCIQKIPVGSYANHRLINSDGDHEEMSIASPDSDPVYPKPSRASKVFGAHRFDSPIENEYLQNFLSMETQQLAALEMFRSLRFSRAREAHVRARKHFLMDQIIFILELEYRGVNVKKTVPCPITSLSLALRHALALWEISPFTSATKQIKSTIFQLEEANDDPVLHEMVAAYCAALSVLFLVKSCKEVNEVKKETWRKNALYYHHVTAILMGKKSVPSFLVRLFADYVELHKNCYQSGSDAARIPSAAGPPVAGPSISSGGCSADSRIPPCSVTTQMRVLKRQLCLLRRMMTLLPVLWECAIRDDTEGPANYGHVSVEDFVLPFSQPEREKTLSSVDCNVLKQAEKVMSDLLAKTDEKIEDPFLKSVKPESIKMTPTNKKVKECLFSTLVNLAVTPEPDASDVVYALDKVTSYAKKLVSWLLYLPEIQSNFNRNGTWEERRDRSKEVCEKLTQTLMSFVKSERLPLKVENMFNYGAICTVVAILSSVLALFNSSKSLITEVSLQEYAELIIAILVGGEENEKVATVKRYIGEDYDDHRKMETLLSMFCEDWENDRIPTENLKQSVSFRCDLEENVNGLLKSAASFEFSEFANSQRNLQSYFKKILLLLDCYNESKTTEFHLSDVMDVVAHSLVSYLAGLYFRQKETFDLTSEYTELLEIDLQLREGRDFLVTPLSELLLVRFKEGKEVERDEASQHLGTGAATNSVTSIGSGVDSRNQTPAPSPTTPPDKPPRASEIPVERDMEQFYNEDERNCDRCEHFAMQDTIQEVFGDFFCNKKEKDTSTVLTGVRESLLASLTEFLASQQLVMGQRLDALLVEEGMKVIQLDSPLFSRVSQLKEFLERNPSTDAYHLAHVLRELDKLLFGGVHAALLRGQTTLEDHTPT